MSSMTHRAGCKQWRVAMLLLCVGILLQASDKRVSRWNADTQVFPFEENSAASAPHQKLLSNDVPAADRRRLIEPQASDEMIKGSREIDSTHAYLQQFEHPGGTQLLPHSY